MTWRNQPTKRFISSELVPWLVPWLVPCPFLAFSIADSNSEFLFSAWWNSALWNLKVYNRAPMCLADSKLLLRQLGFHLFNWGICCLDTCHQYKILGSGILKPEKGFRMARWPSCPLRLQTLLKFCRIFLRFFLCRPLQSKAAYVIKEWSKWADHVRSCSFHCLSSKAWCPAEASCNKAVVWQRAPLSNWLCCKKDYPPLAHPSATYLWICSGWTSMRQGWQSLSNGLFLDSVKNHSHRRTGWESKLL